MANRHLYISSL